jgi:transposase
VSFLFFPSRSHKHVEEALGLSPPPGAVLLSDGYEAYRCYAQKLGLAHAQCWAHARRKFFEAQKYEPDRAAVALDLIGKFYAVEAKIGEGGLTGSAKRAYRCEHTRAWVEKFFDWVEEQFKHQGLLPSNPLIEALPYVRERRAALEVFLDDADVPIDTNHLERALRVIPMGRKNWFSAGLRWAQSTSASPTPSS